MRYLAIFLLTPLLLILAWGYWAYPKSMPRTWARVAFDLLALVLSALAAVQVALQSYDGVEVPVATADFEPLSGGIWQQVLPALTGYGAFFAVLAVAMFVRHFIFRRTR